MSSLQAVDPLLYVFAVDAASNGEGIATNISLTSSSHQQPTWTLFSVSATHLHTAALYISRHTTPWLRGVRLPKQLPASGRNLQATNRNDVPA
ncbi:hypothetical protein PsYK624_101230 [Phanerochaete sordida]|uniref:Uncharacterized protein n=1 Tax=Phanerochaete sordida TaxID=48140 RepID=A0A9P3LHB6_9APHY|nr:hypothetical protein PsYK624_101230 [Phanerochaete sordida]